MYDVQLAYMVVAHSQRDPGEYLLELQQLVKAPSENLRRHAMDMHLKRFPSALQHLMAAGDDHFPQALQLARAKVGAYMHAHRVSTLQQVTGCIGHMILVKSSTRKLYQR